MPELLPAHLLSAHFHVGSARFPAGEVSSRVILCFFFLCFLAGFSLGAVGANTWRSASELRRWADAPNLWGSAASTGK